MAIVTEPKNLIVTIRIDRRRAVLEQRSLQ
jgi:hypothetical protein